MEKMSGVFLEDGRELSRDEWEYDKIGLRRAGNIVDPSVRMALAWLAIKLQLPSNFNLTALVLHAEFCGTADLYWKPRVIPKSEGGKRIIISPKPELKFLQQQINTLLQKTFSRNPNTFGYRGGSCLEVAERHQNLPSTLKLDVKDAFFKVNKDRLQSVLQSRVYWKDNPELSSEGFSWRISNWIAHLCTYHPVPDEIKEIVPCYGSFLPQGAPTSPICFDLACMNADRKLASIARRVGGVFSRYADNYFFSTKNSRISPKLERMIVCTIQQRSGFPIHKVRRVDQGELLRVLGYNILDGKITNTRGFRKKLRGALHVLQRKLELGLDYGENDTIVNGHMGFAKNLPLSLLRTYEHCERLKEENS